MKLYKGKLTQIATVLLVIIFLTLIGWGQATASEEIDLIVESKENIRPGDTVSLSVTVPEELNAMAMEFWLHYDSTQLILVSASEGSSLAGISGGQTAIFSPLDKQEPEPEGTIFFQWDSTKSVISEAGSVLDLCFEVRENASGEVQISLEDACLYDSDMAAMNVACINGAISILPGIEVTVYNSTGTVSPAVVSAPKSGWMEGENIFSVTCDDACVVLKSDDGGTTYTKLKAQAKGNAGYNFTAKDVTSATIIKIVRKGDLNGDGTISSAEIEQIRLLQAGLTTISDFAMLVADINGDGFVGIKELEQIRLAEAGLLDLSW